MNELETTWLKASYSNGQANCFEWAPTQAAATGIVPVRDSKTENGPVLTFGADTFAAFVSGVRNGSI